MKLLPLYFLVLASFLSVWSPLHAQQGPSRSGHPSRTQVSVVRNVPCGGDVVLSEPFSGSGLPAGWQAVDRDGKTLRSELDTLLGPGWQSITDFKDSQNRAMASASWYQEEGPSDDWLITPQVSLPDNPCLSWFAYSQDGFFRETYEVRISTTTSDPDSFFTREPIAVIRGETDTIRYRSINLSAFANQEVYIAFRQVSEDKFILVLDDVRISDVQNRDLAMFEVIAPTGSVDDQEEFPIRGAIANLGSNLLVLDSAVNLFYSIDNGPPDSMIIADSLVMVANDSVQFVHDSVWTPTADGVYRLCVWFKSIGDDNVLNDTLVSVLWLGRIYQYPSVNRSRF